MKKILIATLTAALVAAPAFAGSMTVGFTDAAEGTTTVMTFDEDGTASVEGVEGTFPYTWDEATKELCGDATGEGEVCATIATEGAEPAVGQKSAYTTSDGRSGMSEITAMTE